jgi:hypothetical protein
MASIKTDQDPNGLRNNFEAAATHLLPYDPVQKKRPDHAGGKRGAGDISDVTHEEADVSAFGAKKGIGKTGVHLRYHPREEYVKLSSEQKDELREWRDTTGGGKGKRGRPNNKDGKPRRNVAFKSDKAIAAAVEKKVNERLKADERNKSQGDEAEAYIMSIFQKMNGTKATVSAAELPPVVTTPIVPPTLHGIIRRARNNNK